MNRYIISVECPSCGAPLDFNEGSNAVQCTHCRSNLLVTGRKQILSYYVDPKIDMHVAVADALIAQKARGLEISRIVSRQLYFIPYYRLTGHDFRWEKAIQKALAEEDDSLSPLTGLLDCQGKPGDAGVILRRVFKFSVSRDNEPDAQERAVSSLFLACGRTADAVPNEAGEIQLNDRYVEKNFIACNLSGEAPYSLGVRPAVLKLKLFRKEAIAPLGKTAPVDISPEAALSRGMMADSTGELISRTVIGRILSIIYFPFWIVEMEARGETLLVILDAVSKGVIKADAAPSLCRILDRPSGDRQKTVDFRPLVCPSCGWDLPVRPDDVIFLCPSCNKAWQIYGSCLNEVAYRVAGIQGSGKKERVRYFPFWVLQGKQGGDYPARFFLPAFHYRRLKFLSDLAMGLTRKQPVYSDQENKTTEIRPDSFTGCFYDQEDAALLAHFTDTGIKLAQRNKVPCPSGELSFVDATLMWLPFSVQGPSFVEPFTGINISQGLLL